MAAKVFVLVVAVLASCCSGFLFFKRTLQLNHASLAQSLLVQKGVTLLDQSDSHDAPFLDVDPVDLSRASAPTALSVPSRYQKADVRRTPYRREHTTSVKPPTENLTDERKAVVWERKWTREPASKANNEALLDVKADTRLDPPPKAWTVKSPASVRQSAVTGNGRGEVAAANSYQVSKQQNVWSLKTKVSVQSSAEFSDAASLSAAQPKAWTKKGSQFTSATTAAGAITGSQPNIAKSNPAGRFHSAVTPPVVSSDHQLFSEQNMQATSTAMSSQRNRPWAMGSNNADSAAESSPDITKPQPSPPRKYERSSETQSRSSDGAQLLLTPLEILRLKVPRAPSDTKARLAEEQQRFSELSASYRDAAGGSRTSGSGASKRPPLSGPRPSFKQGAAPGTSGANNRFKNAGGQHPGANRPGGGLGSRDRRGGRLSEDSALSEGDEYGYGDQQGGASLRSVSGLQLCDLEADGLSPEEIAAFLELRLGVRTTAEAVQRRLIDARIVRRVGRRNGKTRRNKQRLWRARNFPEAERLVHLPASGRVAINRLVAMMEVEAGAVARHLKLEEGVFVDGSETQTIDNEMAARVVEAFGKKLSPELLDGDEVGDDYGDDDRDEEEEEEEEEANAEAVANTGETVTAQSSRPGRRLARQPVVTIMGHVDHGKTTLLDTIRNASVARGEAGGITQGISAFSVRTPRGDAVTFIDTPGHAAFSEMRRRGANATDIVVLVVAADDGVMEQTKECIAAAVTAGCPIVVAINKIDKTGCDAEAVKLSLQNHGVQLEEFGGDTQCALVSARDGVGIDGLLEQIQLQAELMNLRSTVVGPAEGVALEARVDRRLGVVVSGIVQRGVLRVGDLVLAGSACGKVKKILSDSGVAMDEAPPAIPIQFTGLNVVPGAGEKFLVVHDEQEAREVAAARLRLAKERAGSRAAAAKLALVKDLMAGAAQFRQEVKVPVVVKADVAGSVEALRDAFAALEQSDDSMLCRIDVVFAGVGDVTSSDVAIAAASKAKLVAFNVAAGHMAASDARASGVQIGFYSVVYELLDELAAQVTAALAPPPPGELLGRAEVLQLFTIGKVGKIAGCRVLEGSLEAQSKVRVLRGPREVLFSGAIGTLKSGKDSVGSVSSGSECGVALKGFTDFAVGDVIECFALSQESADEISSANSAATAAIGTKTAGEKKKKKKK